MDNLITLNLTIKLDKSGNIISVTWDNTKIGGGISLMTEGGFLLKTEKDENINVESV